MRYDLDFSGWLALWAHWNPLPVALYASIGVLGAALYLVRRAQRRASQAQQLLQEAREWFHFVLGSVKDYAILMLDTEGCVAGWNVGAENILGYEASEVLGKHFSCFHTPEQIARGEPVLSLAQAASRGQFDTEGWRVRKDGSRLWANVVVTALHDAAGQLQGYIKITRDISERKRAEEELLQREELMDSFWAASPMGLAILDLDFRFLRINGALAAMTGQTASACLGKNVAEVLGELAPQMQGWLQEVVVTGAPMLNRELRGPRRGEDGEPVCWVSSYFPVLNQEGKAQQIGALMLDISERVKAEELLRESEDTLRRLSGQLLRLQDEERRRIARELHDSIGQCLVAIKINLENLAGQIPAQNPRAAKALEDTRVAADQCLTDTRTISHLLHPPLLDRLGLPSALRSFVEGFAQRSGIQVQLDIAPDFLRLPADFETALFRIVQESLTNIHRHSGSSTAEIRLALDAEYLSLEVSDQGRGIPRERLHVCNGNKSAAGVGIAGMRERVQQLGGRLVVESRGRGTTVRAVLPMVGLAVSNLEVA